MIDRDGAPLAALVHDASLDDEPELLPARRASRLNVLQALHYE